MISWFRHQTLVKKGLACDKMRRQRAETSWWETFDHSMVVKLWLLSLLAFSLFGLSYWGTGLPSHETNLLTFLVFFCALMRLELDLSDLWESNLKLLLVFTCIWLNLFLVKGVYLWTNDEVGPFTATSYYLLPCAFAPLLVSLLLGTRPALYAVLFLSVMSALLVHQSFSLLAISMVTGFVAVHFTRRVRKRGDLVKAGVAVGVIGLFCAIAFNFAAGPVPRYDLMLQQGALALGMGIATALIVSAVLPIFESAFDVITDISWIEMADLNHTLMQQMAIEAPGTYHHSLYVANLAEAAAIALGLNPTKCRVMAYFHDIGKVVKPEYFTENIRPGANPHENLSPSMSALIIVAHVKEGVDMALKERLKRPLIDAIQQHHGDSLVYYFYKRAKQMEADAREGGKIMNMRDADIPEVSENSFRYPGPKPQTKEIAILSLADSIEAASRSLERPTPQRIENLVQEIVKSRMLDGQLDECNLTLNEIHAAAESFVFTVKNMLHTRISYPKDERPATTASNSPASNGKTHAHGHSGERKERPFVSTTGTVASLQPAKKDPPATGAASKAA